MSKMVSVAMMYLLVLEPFLAVKLDELNPPQPPRKTDRTSSLLESERRLAKFYLFTRSKPVKSRALDLKKHESFDGFDPTLESKVIIHGFLDRVQIADWMHEMKDEFLKLDDFNVIIVDWSSGNSIPYSRAAANTERIGKEISHLLAHLRDRFGAQMPKFHIIGHSLGSHVAGFVGENIEPIGRITGLDPAMYHFKDASPRKRLDPSDALFVDVIHTDAGGIGMVKPVGHVDFYPNGGSVQPGCTATNYISSLLDKGVVESVRSLICSHMRAIPLFTESINSRTCQMSATRCSSWAEYESGNCCGCGPKGEKCAVMGLHTDVTRDYGNHSYYMLTADRSPYCVFEYRLKILDEDDGVQGRWLIPPRAKSDKTNKRKFWITLLGNTGETEFMIDERNEYDRQSFIVTSAMPLGAVDGAVIKWKAKPLNKALSVLNRVMRTEEPRPHIRKMEITPANVFSELMPKFVLCVSPRSMESQNNIIGLRSIYC